MLNPTTIKPGDKVIVSPESIQRYGTTPTDLEADTVYEVASVRPRNDAGEVYVRIEGASLTYGYEWFDRAPLQVGDRVDTVEKWNTLPVGTVLTDRDGWVFTKTVETYQEAGENATYVESDGGSGTFNAPFKWDTVLTSLPGQEADETEAPGRPTIDLSNRATARSYASEILDVVGGAAKYNTSVVLTDLVAGRAVDAYEVNEALLDAMRTVGRRSSGRGPLGTKVAYLGHIVQAVLDNHADGLPAYADGERSRKVKSLEEEKGRLVAQVERLERRVEVEEQNAEVARSAAADHEAERDVLDLVLQYAFERLTETQKQRVYGYWDGVIKD